MATRAEEVQQLYIAYLGRAADKAGLDYWVSGDGAGLDLAQLRANFVNEQPEYEAIYGGLNRSELVTQIYQNLLERAPDADGLEYWVNGGGATVPADDLLLAVINGALASDVTTIANKVEVAQAYTAAAGADYTSASASAAIADVDATQASVNAALEQIRTDFPGQAGETYSLTVGVDNIDGTADNDTINALPVNSTTGAAATTLSSFDDIDGGAGQDTLNIYTADGGTGDDLNASLPTTASVQNVETINIYNDTGALFGAGTVNAAQFVGANAVWQIANAGSVTGLGVSTTAGFRNITTGPLAVTAAATAASATVALDNVDEAVTLSVGGAALTTAIVGGTRADGDASGTVAPLGLTVVAGTDVQTVTVNSSFFTNLAIDDSGSAVGKEVTTVDASGSDAGVSFLADADVTTIMTGSGKDSVTLATDTLADNPATTTVNEAVSASLTAGAGDDTIAVNTSGTGTTTVDAGAGDDIVAINSRSDGVLTVNLGDGADGFSSTAPINGTDVIDAGAGIDTLALTLVGSANIGAFRNFDVFDVAGLSASLNTGILATNNNVTEFVASAGVGTGAALTNVGSGVGFRATGTMDADMLALTQATAGSLTVTVDADETGTADTDADSVVASVSATNATSLEAVFATDYLAEITGEAAGNTTTLNLHGVASTLSVASGGASSSNVLSYTDTSTTNALTSVTVAGDRALTLNVAGATDSLATVDSSALTGGLTFSLANLAEGGTVQLGSGADTITATSASTTGGIESVVNFEKASAAAVGTDTTAAAAAQADADVLALGAVDVAVDGTVTGGAIEDGVLTFSGAGPTDLAAAIGIADAIGSGAVVFEFLGDSYVFVQDVTTDTVVQLVGLTGVSNFAEVGATNEFFIV